MPPKVSVRTKDGTRKGKDDVEKLLSDLDSLAPPSSSSSDAPSADASASDGAQKASTSKQADATDAQSLLDDLDSLVQRRPLSRGTASKPGTPTKASSLSRTTSTSALAKEITPDEKQDTAATSTVDASAGLDPAVSETQSTSSSAGAKVGSGVAGWSAWGGSVWSSATKLADTARTELEKRAKSEQAKELTSKGWGFAQNVRGYLQETNLEKIGADLTQVGKKGWTDIINAVAPPIAAHEIIQVNLSHDMLGYDGISDVVFRTLTRVMEQHAGDAATEQQLVVNRPPQSQASPSTPSAGAKPAGSDDARDINAVEGFEEALKVAEVNLEQLMKAGAVALSKAPSQKGKGKEVDGANEAPSSTSSSMTLPITTCPVYVRIQPCLAPLPWSSASGEKSLFFLLLLKDSSNNLDHQTLSQAVPESWLNVPFEENAWVEQGLTDVLEVALSVIGQDYVNGRMTGRSSAGKEAGDTSVGA